MPKCSPRRVSPNVGKVQIQSNQHPSSAAQADAMVHIRRPTKPLVSYRFRIVPGFSKQALELIRHVLVKLESHRVRLGAERHDPLAGQFGSVLNAALIASSGTDG